MKKKRKMRSVYQDDAEDEGSFGLGDPVGDDYLEHRYRRSFGESH